MRLVGTLTVAARIEAVWDLFQDPDALCALASSCESARRIDGTRYEGIVKMRVSLLSARALVLGEVLEVDPPRSMRVAISGRTTGVPGSFDGIAQLWLRQDESATHGEYEFDLNILGRLGALGQPLFQTAGQRIVTTFAHKVSQRLAS